MAVQSHFDISMIGSVFQKLGEFFHIKVILAAIMVGLGWVFQNDYQVLISVYVLIAFDTITGIWYAARQKDLSSRGFYRVTVKCLVYFLMIIVGRIVDKHAPINFAATIMEGFLVGTEAFSILENVSKLGFPVPTKLLKLLKIYYDKK